MERLVEEIHRVLNSPYAVPLKGLHNIICGGDVYLLELWTSSHQCEVEALTSIVIDSLSWCPFAAPVLEQLVTTERLRSAFLRQRPTLLDALLKKAVVSQQGFGRYSQICVSMLSAPLPVPVPVSLGPLFHKSLEEATKSPSACTLRRVYALVSGQCSALPEVLSPEQMVTTQEQLLSILKHQDGQAIHLLCLGTFARLVTSRRCPPLPASNTSQNSSPSIESASTSGERDLGLITGFFSAQRASKTIELVVLQVISTCSNNNGLSNDEALENVQLATVIVDAVEPDLKGAWVKTNERAMRKLYEKVLRRGIPSLLQFLAFEFILCMSYTKSLPPAFPKSFQTLIRSRLQCQTMDNHSIRLSANTIEKMAPRFEEGFIGEALRIILSTITQSEPGVAHMSRLRDCQAFLGGIGEIVEDSPAFRKGMFSALSTNELAKPLREFCEMSISERRLTDGCAKLKFCWTQFQESRRHLALSLCLLILKAALHSSGDECGIETSFALSLLGRQKDFAVPMPPCPSARHNRISVDLPLVALLEQKSTPQVIRASHEWKSRLAESLLRDATQRHELIVNTVSEVCRDLEERCEDIERPLREERTKLGSTQARLNESNLKIAALEVETSERELFLDGLEAEKSRLESQVSSLSQQIQDLEHLLRQATDDTLGMKAVARDDMKKLELSHLAVVTVKDESITELEQKTKRMEQELRRLSDELGVTARDKIEAQGNLMIVQKELAECRVELEQAKVTNVLKHTEIDSLGRLNEVLKANIEALNHNLRESSTRAEKMRSEFQETQKLLSVELELVKNGRETDASEAVAQVAKAKILYNRDMDEARTLLQDARRDLSLERQQHGFKVMALEKEVCDPEQSGKVGTPQSRHFRIKKMRSEREERAREFLHAQDLSRKLVAVMGVSSAIPRPPDLAIEGFDAFADDLKDPDNLKDQPSEEWTEAPRDDSGDGRRNKRGNGTSEGANMPASSYSPTRSGSTPKRSKVRKQVKPPSARQTRQTQVIAGAQTVEAIKNHGRQDKRSPLGELVAGNRNTPQAVTVRKAHHNLDGQPDRLLVSDGLHPNPGGESMDLEDFSFDDSEFSTSTQKYQNDPSRHMDGRSFSTFGDSAAGF
ncbi:MAG: hypothetical protein M1839_000642 [Geoglossum umbratile]|nr:MAG: hypothetical protein M1839_000642 [Geoglossum umbratile]